MDYCDNCQKDNMPIKTRCTMCDYTVCDDCCKNTNQSFKTLDEFGVSYPYCDECYKLAVYGDDEEL